MDLEAAIVELRRALAHEPARLDLVALAIARLDDEAGSLADDEVLQTLDAWAEQVRSTGDLVRVLGDEAGLRGGDDDYDAPAHSFLPRVLEHRRGLPILLSLVYLEVARRARLPLFGLALPGHFVVAHPLGGGELIVLDPFDGGRTMSPRELAALVARAGARLDPSSFVPAAPHAIATRMLRNLVGSYQRRDLPDHVHSTARLWLAIDPHDEVARLALAATDDGLN
jgi:regulator of sirC expression with transglutaminase-like and TPR domain